MFFSVLHFFSQFLLFLGGVVLGRALFFLPFFSSLLSRLWGGRHFVRSTMPLYLLLWVLLVGSIMCATAMTMMSFFSFSSRRRLRRFIILSFSSIIIIIIIISRRRSGRSTSALFEFVQQRERGRVESVSDDWFVLVVDEETNHAT